jgi:hypothetical protein
VHVFVARGRLTLHQLDTEAELAEGDAVRLTASSRPHVAANEAAEILVWEMHAALGG